MFSDFTFYVEKILCSTKWEMVGKELGGGGEG